MKLTLMQRAVSIMMNRAAPEDFKNTAQDMCDVLTAVEKLDPANPDPEKIAAIKQMLEPKEV